ncbi:MAG: hypothetical protein AAF663_02630 [Planctomycetota bacterium]
MTYQADLTFRFGQADPNGLDGANAVVELTFADDASYIDVFGQNVEAVAASATVTVTGASQPAANGTFTTLPDRAAGILLTAPDDDEGPTFFIGLAGDAGNRSMVFDLPFAGLGFSSFAEVTSLPIPSPGDPLRVDDFPATIRGSFANNSTSFGGNDPSGVFGESNEVFTVIATTPSINGDFNGSGQVEQSDLNLVLNNWGGNRTFEDGVTTFATNLVDQEELNAVLNNWGSLASPVGTPASIPEPAVAAGLLLTPFGIRTRTATYSSTSPSTPS